MKKLMLTILFLFCVAGATNYYVDFDGGNDAANGTSTSTQWRTIPGTRTKDESGYKNFTWGAISTANKMHNDVIYIKPGTVYDTADGGAIYINRDYYTSNVSILIDTVQGKDTVIMDFDGAALFPAIFVRVDSVSINGVIARGITVKNCQSSGILVKEKPGTGLPVIKFGVENISFYNNGTPCTAEDECDIGQIQILHADDISIDKCRINGNGNHLMGIMLGESGQRVDGGIVSNCVSYNHTGEDPPNDRGIGVKAFNSYVTFDACSTYDNLKGFDLGELNIDSDTCLYIVKNCVSFDNKYGINFNGAGAVSEEIFKFYMINCIVHDNAYTGSNTYAAPFDIYLTGNTFYDNGTDDATSKEKGNLILTPSTVNNGPLNAYIYNNIFYKPSGHTNWSVSNFFPNTTAIFNIYSDYNSFVKDSGHTQTEYFCKWAYYSAEEGKLYSYGSNGPGNIAGDWYTEYGKTETIDPAGNIGHWHCDANSKGTGAADTILPPFVSYATDNVALDSAYIGTNLSLKPWYIPAMGLDISGKIRTGWDIGAYEFNRRIVDIFIRR